MLFRSSPRTLGLALSCAPACAAAASSQAQRPSRWPAFRAAMPRGTPRSAVSSPSRRLLRLPGTAIGHTLLALRAAGRSATSNGSESCCGWRFAPACCAAQSVSRSRRPRKKRRASAWPCRRRCKFSAPLRLLRRLVCQGPKARPNRSVNRSANSWAPCPRSSRCLCCASRARHPAAVARLPLR